MLTPIDIQNHVLKSTMGGYNKKETDDFIESVQASYEQLYKENHDLKEKITALSEGLQYYKKMEGTLQKTLVLAEKTATETLEASRTKASKVEKESQEKANVMLSSAKAKADAMVSETEEKVNALLEESQKKADSLLTESQIKAEATISEAQTKADNMLANATERVDRVLAEAKTNADSLLDETKESTEQMLTEANRQLGEVSSTVRKLIDCYDAYKEQFKALLNKQLAQLEDPAFLIQMPELEQTLESQQVTIAESQASLLNKIDEMAAKAEELDLPIDASSSVEAQSPSETSLNWEAGGEEESAKGESVETATDVFSETPFMEFPEESVAEPVATATEEMAAAPEPSADLAEESTTFSEDTAALEALAAMADAAVAEEAKTASSGNNLEDIALEALRKVNSEVIPKTPLSSDETSMLGTSYDDFDPNASHEAEPEQPVAPMPDFASAMETPSFEQEAEQPVVPMPDFASAAEAPSFEQEAEQPVVPMPDFASAMETPSFEQEAEQPVVPMPDFASAMKTPSFEQEAEQPVVPMPGFTGAVEYTTTDGESEVNPDAYSDTTIHAENYITSETYFGSADNIPYTGAVADFSNGISGGETTGQTESAEASTDLFSADFSGAAAAPADEFAVGGDSSNSGEDTPFTFIDAN